MRSINEPVKVTLSVKCPICEYIFKFAPRCPECGQLIDYGFTDMFYKADKKEDK